MSFLERVTIKGLHGKKSIDAVIDDDTLILVGENGSGKTTFLRLLFHVLSGRWLSLAQYRFETIRITISGTTYEIARDAISKGFDKLDKRFLSDFPPPVRHRLLEVLRIGDVDRLPMELERIRSRYGISVDQVMRQLSLFDDQPQGLSKELKQQIAEIQVAVNAQVLYLPTYRRIERELSSIFEGFDPDDLRRSKHRMSGRETERAFVELVEFGMQDVERAIRGVLEEVKDFARENLNNLTLKYLGDVVNQEYKSVGMLEISHMSEDAIQGVLNRIHESILGKDHKAHLFNVINSARSDASPDEHTKIICHYFLKLLSFQEALQQRERKISEFCDLCSAYIVDKKFTYDSTKFNFLISYQDDSSDSGKVQLSDLSSGEKQIVSLFSHLYLSGNKQFLVLIDEPELSLSVPWQRHFLSDIRKGGFCKALIAVTHSPFIYDNELRGYARSLGEFETLGGL